MSIEISNNTIWIALSWKDNDENKTENSKEIARKKILDILEKVKQKPSIPVSHDEKKWLLIDIVV